MENLHVKIETVDGNVLTVLQGQALEQVPPNKINISGDIKTMSNFLNARNIWPGHGLQDVNPSKAIVIVDKRNLTITLQLDPENHYGATFTGTLLESEELKPFCINEKRTFTKIELVQLLKFNRIFFEDLEKHAELVKAFQKVSSTVNIKANDSSDERGNKEHAFVKEVTTNAPTEFILSIPIWKGFRYRTFRVDICLDVTEGSARFWFESVELHEMKQKDLDEIFNAELKAAGGFVTIYK